MNSNEMTESIPATEPRRADTRNYLTSALPRLSAREIHRLRIKMLLSRQGLGDDINIATLRLKNWMNNESCPCDSGNKFKSCCRGKVKRLLQNAATVPHVMTYIEAGVVEYESVKKG